MIKITELQPGDCFDFDGKPFLRFYNGYIDLSDPEKREVSFHNDVFVTRIGRVAINAAIGRVTTF